MKRRINILMVLAMAVMTASCDIFSFDKGPDEIRLYARFGNSDFQTRSLDTSYVYHTQSQVEVPVAIVRIDETDAKYPSFDGCGAYSNATMRTPDNAGYRTIHFNKAQFYKNSTDYIKYTGFSPIPTAANYSSTASATTATYPVDGKTDVLYGSVVTGKEDEPFETMYFNHALSEVRIWVYQTVSVDENGNAIITQDDWGTFDQLTLEGLINECSLTLPKEEEQELWGISYGTNTFNLEFSEGSDLYFNPGEIPTSASEKRLVGTAIIAPPSDRQLNIRYKTSDSSTSKLITIAKDFRAGYAYDVVLRFSQFGIIESSVSIADWSGHEGELTDVTIDQGVKVYNNLSRYGTANCYIINSGNFLYGFDCKTKGNGDVSLVDDYDASLNVNYLKILWKDSSFPETVKDSYGANVPYLKLTEVPAENLAKFEVAGNTNPSDHTLTYEGNVLIGGYDKNPDEGGQLLWTWHLWLSKKVEANGDNNGYIIHDRNLGATSTNKNGGLYYQWGRLTPLQSNQYTSSSKASSIDAAIKAYDTGFGSASTDWLEAVAENTTTLWGFQNDFKEQKKTIYDPCPLGYVVADKRVWETNSISTGDDVWTFASTSQGTAMSFNGSLSQSSRGALKHVRCIAEGKEARYVTNLSEAQTANCYIVSKNGYYKFSVLTRGNGVSNLEPVGGNGLIWDINHGLSPTIRQIDIASVKPRWWQGDFRTYGTWNNITPSNSVMSTQMGGIQFLQSDGTWSTDHADVDEDGYVTFQVENWTAGNLLLAAYDLNDVVLWSWHIWMTEKPDNIRQGDYALLDRNLGATYVPSATTISDQNERWASYGFFYQWGRKDPLFHEAPTDNASGTVSGNTATSSVWFFNDPTSGWTRRNSIDLNSTACSVSNDDARKTPEVFFKASAQAGGNSEWFLTEYTDDKTATSFWGYAVYSTAMGRSFTKTINDPCPPGYRTLSHDSLFLNAGDGGYGPTEITSYNSGGVKVNGKGTDGIITNNNGGDIFWPFSGKRDYTGKSSTLRTSCHYATGMPMGSQNVRSAEFYRETSTSKYYHVQRNGGYGKSTAMVVRCMKE